ncbi:MAG: hypothetical protein KDF65_14515 [Anaerolineae bacterium]|nr:hypothetical protein [Anaerolineae bacterium]
MKMKLNRVIRSSLLSMLLFIMVAAVALAHGVIISYAILENGKIEMWAEFDTGEVMSEAQVVIYSPEDPATPWLTAKADETGYFAFSPDQTGTWDVQFRVAGHGDIIHIPVEQVAEVSVESDTGAAVTEAVEAEAEAEVEAPALEEVAVAEAAGETTEVASDAMEAEPVAAEVEETMAEDEAHDMAEMDAAPAVETEPEPAAAPAEAPAAESASRAAPERVVATSSTGLTTPQILLMSGSVIWGFIGTALFFVRKGDK